MNAAKIFLAGLIFALVFSFTAAHAEDVDSYFSWEIKNLDDYQKYDALFKDVSPSDEVSPRNEIYKRISLGRYYEALLLCSMSEVYQKIVLGTNYFDESFTELTAKLYLETDELDAAERKIIFLLNNAPDNLTKVRASILKVDLLNRRGNYREAFQTAQEVENLLKSTPDDKLTLINLSRAARACNGLEDINTSLKIVNAIYPAIQTTFGENSVEMSYLASTLIELCLKTKDYEKGKGWLNFKESQANKNANANLPAVAEIETEAAKFYFETNDTARGKEMLSKALTSADSCSERNYLFESLKLYKEINSVAAKYLDENNPLVLNSEFGLAYVKSNAGDFLQATEFYEKNLPKFKKRFGEENGDTLDMMDTLGENYLLLGRYVDAKKLLEENLSVCQKHFGDNAGRTIENKIDLARVYYRMGRYNTADKLLDDIQAQNAERFAQSPAPEFVYRLWFAKADGACRRGDVVKYAEYLQNIKALLRKDNPQSYSELDINGKEIELILELSKLLSMEGLAYNNAEFESSIVNIAGIVGVSNPKILEMMNATAETYILYGNLKEAERYVNRILKLNRTHFGGNNLCEWRALTTQAKIRRAEKNFPESLKLDNQALQIAETVCGKNSLERLQSMDALAADHAEAGNFTEAIKIRERALAQYKKILEEDDAISIQMKTNLAEDYIAAKRYPEAVKLCDETLALQQIPPNANNHISFFPIATELIRVKATAQKLSGDDANAYANYKNLIQAYEARRAAAAQINPSLSNAENKSKWFAQVVPVYKDAAAVAASDKVGDVTFAFGLTELCRGRNLVDRFNDVLVAKEYLLTPSEKQKLAEYQQFADACRNVSEYAAAKDDDILFLYAEQVYHNLRALAERYKGDLREKYSANVKPKNFQNRPQALNQLEEFGFKMNYTSVKSDDENLNLYLDELVKTNVWERPTIWSWDKLMENFDVEKNRKAIPNGACLVEFMKISDDSLLVTFLRNKDELHTANIPVDKNFFDSCRLYHEMNSYPDFQAMNRDRKYLWQTGGGEYIINDRLTAPVVGAKPVNDNDSWLNLRHEISVALSAKLMPTLEKFAGDASYWIISPDAELNLVPFETLLYHEKFLVESKDVSYVPSLTVLNLMKNRERKNSYLGRSKELFAMGDAIYGESGSSNLRGSQSDFFRKLRNNPDEKIDLSELKWNNLPDTARELENVSNLFGSKEIFRREQVTEKNLRELNARGELSKYKYLLFSTHGIFIPERPELSSIVLSQRFNDLDTDGYVTVGEWLGYNLNSDLVYLSACESGLGDYQAGEGIVGIPYALTMAGNKDTVMSLWKVEVTATTEFTSAVFEKLSREQSEVSALNETKREFLRGHVEKFKSPSVWAAFLLYGI